MKWNSPIASLMLPPNVAVAGSGGIYGARGGEKLADDGVAADSDADVGADAGLELELDAENSPSESGETTALRSPVEGEVAALS